MCVFSGNFLRQTLIGLMVLKMFGHLSIQIKLGSGILTHRRYLLVEMCKMWLNFIFAKCANYERLGLMDYLD